MANHTGSGIVSLLFAVLAIGCGQLLKTELSSTRSGTLMAGGLGALVFVFVLTAVSNLQMASKGSQAKAGLLEVGVCLAVALLISASIHRVAVTVCFMFSIVALYFISGISHAKYSTPVVQQTIIAKKKK